jgi:uncharacterized damage-inducible protein DinB
MTTSQLVSELRGITQTNIDLIRKKFSHLNDQQKNWRKDSESWSINEVFAHLNEFAHYYHQAFTSKIERTRFNEPKDVFISSPLGRSAWKSMKLGNLKNIKRKFKAQRIYNPLIHSELVKGKDSVIFESNQIELLKIIDKAELVNLRKVKVPISISKIVRLRLGDALLFVVYHNERHMQQALNILSNNKFPK